MSAASATQSAVVALEVEVGYVRSDNLSIYHQSRLQICKLFISRIYRKESCMMMLAHD
jgi:uncharacterized linocin/CFP29 family protein